MSALSASLKLFIDVRSSSASGSQTQIRYSDNHGPIKHKMVKQLLYLSKQLQINSRDKHNQICAVRAGTSIYSHASTKRQSVSV